MASICPGDVMENEPFTLGLDFGSFFYGKETVSHRGEMAVVELQYPRKLSRSRLQSLVSAIAPCSLPLLGLEALALLMLPQLHVQHALEQLRRERCIPAPIHCSLHAQLDSLTTRPTQPSSHLGAHGTSPTKLSSLDCIMLLVVCVHAGCKLSRVL